MINLQLAEKRVETDGSVDVQEIFPTVQGEGPFAGRPAVFLRLAGCNLQCPACDTDYTSRRALFPLKTLESILVSELVQQANRWPKIGYRSSFMVLVITGGEPFRQACGPLVSKLLQSQWLSNLHIQFETNGTLYDPSMVVDGDYNLYEHERVHVVCSPKTGSISRELMPHITDLKYVLGAGMVDPSDGLPTSSLLSGVVPAKPWKGFNGTVYVQPLDDQDEELNKRNTAAAVESCMKFGYTLCVQLHKIVGLP